MKKGCSEGSFDSLATFFLIFNFFFNFPQKFDINFFFDWQKISNFPPLISFAGSGSQNQNTKLRHKQQLLQFRLTPPTHARAIEATLHVFVRGLNDLEASSALQQLGGQHMVEMTVQKTQLDAQVAFNRFFLLLTVTF